MARLPRSTFPDYGVWHVTTRGVERRQVYLDRGDARHFLLQLGRAVEALGLEVYAVCLMPNHYHLIVECLRDSLSKAMHRVNGRYAEWFNAKYRRSGHLWGDRFALWQVRDEEHLREAVAYVLNNPVRAALCETAADWPWSGSRYPSAPLGRELGAHADRRARTQKGRHGAPLVRDLRHPLEAVGVDPVRPGLHVEVGRDHPVPLPLHLVDRDRAGDVEPVDGAPRPRDLPRQRRRIAARVGRREQLLGTRLPRLVGDPRRQVDRQLERTGRPRRGDARPARQRPPPSHRCDASDPRH
jgi:REP element-mobilizing transposase RayT